MTTDTILVQENYFCTKIIQLNGKVFINQTGILPVKSSRGHTYIMVMHDHNSKKIVAKALKSKGSAEQLASTTKLHTHLYNRGQKLKFT